MLLFWPGVVLVAALLNMLVSWVFSWQELVIGYVIGLVIGVCFYFGTTGWSTDGSTEAGAVQHVRDFFLVVSTGLFGLLKWAGVEALKDPSTLFWWTALSVVVGTLVSAALDRAAVAIGRTMSVGGGVLSGLIFFIKAPFALFTTGLGIVIGLLGLAVGAISSKKVGFGFLGGSLYFECGFSGTYATTFSSVINVWRGKMSDPVGSQYLLDHELYHTRQYIYMQDWLGVFYFTIAPIWGLISSAASSRSFSSSYAFRASGEVGSPIEVAPYKIRW